MLSLRTQEQRRYKDHRPKSWCWSSWMCTHQKCTRHGPQTLKNWKINSKGIIDLNIRCRTIKPEDKLENPEDVVWTWFFILFLGLHLFEKESGKQHGVGERRGRGRLPTEPGAQCGTLSWDPGIMSRAKGRHLTDPATQLSWKLFSYSFPVLFCVVPTLVNLLLIFTVSGTFYTYYSLFGEHT